MHPQIENEEIIERYVRRQLSVQERQAFEEHFMGCDECFEKLQTMEQFVAGIHDAAIRGMFEDAGTAVPRRSDLWFKWAFAATATAAVILGAVTAWAYLAGIPKLRREVDRAAAELQAEQRLRADLERKAASLEQPEANIPLVILQASRAARDEAASIVVQPASRHIVLWIDIDPSRYRDFRLEVFSQDSRLVASLEHLDRGPYGAIAASLPADQLPAGDFRIRLSAQDQQPSVLIGEYQLKVRRP